MAEYTAIRVTEDAKEAAEESKRDGETWNEFIQRCAENPPEVREFVDTDALEEMHKKLDQLQNAQGQTVSEALDIAENDTQITYDDVKAACSAAVRDELPEELR